VDADDDGVSFNTAYWRAKPRHIALDPRVSLTVVDRANAYRWLNERHGACIRGPARRQRRSLSGLIVVPRHHDFPHNRRGFEHTRWCSGAD
jgi:hypothetical protein